MEVLVADAAICHAADHALLPVAGRAGAMGTITLPRQIHRHRRIDRRRPWRTCPIALLRIKESATHVARLQVGRSDYERWRTSAARPRDPLVTERRGDNWSAPMGGRRSIVPMTGA